MESKTVIVCLASEYARGTYRCFAAREYCFAYEDGICKSDDKPCDAVEYRPVVRGKWLRDEYGHYTCSVCKKFNTDEEKDKGVCAFNLCPSCGAKMEADLTLETKTP